LTAQSFERVKKVTGSSFEQCKSITTDEFGNVYSVGIFLDTIIFNESLTPVEFISKNNSSAIFIQKMDENGNLIWAKKIDGNNSEFVSNIIVDNNNDLIIVGLFKDTVDFDPGINETVLISNNERDIFVLKLSSMGELIWVKNYGSTGLIGVGNIYIDDSLNIVVSGNFEEI